MRDVLISCARCAKDGSRISMSDAIIVPEQALISVRVDWLGDGNRGYGLGDGGHACVVQLQAKELKPGMMIPGCDEESILVMDVKIVDDEPVLSETPTA